MNRSRYSFFAVAGFLSICFVLTFTPGLYAQTSEDPRTAEVDKLFERFDIDGSTGAVVSIVEDGELVYVQGYGMANIEHAIPNDPSITVFQAASIAKQFTSFAALLLEQDGLIDMDDDVRKYIPELHDFGKTITLRHLATHTSGLRDQWNLLKLAGWRMDDIINQEHVFRLIERQRELNFDPGSEFRYSNTGHTLLAEVIARVTGMSFADYTTERIFEPLGMSNTLFLDDHETLIENLATSYNGNIEDGFRKAALNISSPGATNLYTTAEDMSKWARNFDVPIIGDEKLIAQFNSVPTLNNGSKSRYAYGQYPLDYHGLQAYEHSGAEAAFEAYFIRFPEQKFAVSILANDGSFWAEGRGLRIANIYLGDLLEEEKEADQGESNAKAEDTPEFVVTLSDYEGRYYSEELDTFYTLSATQDGLRAVHQRVPDINLVAVIPDTFESKTWFFKSAEFERDYDGNVAAFRISNRGVTGLLFSKVAR